MAALKLAVLKLLNMIKNFFGVLSGYLDWIRTNEDRRAGANEVKVSQNDKRDEIRKDADRIWDGDNRNRLQRTSSKGRK